jgi:ubiquinone/menaquinone biosynthesis C-methylase UbiE
VQFKDHFSKQAAEYAKFRPRYPGAMFEYLAGLTPAQELAWDCATGNGQAAIGLAAVFKKVIATDASDEQIANAEPHQRVEYRVASAEENGLAPNSADLILVAQALHWLDRSRFYPEVHRVLKHHGVFSASGYKFLRLAPEIDEIVNRRYYEEVVGPYWPPERTLIEQFGQVPFPFPELPAQHFEMVMEWTLEQLIGYLRSWSATQRFIAQQKRNPLDQILVPLQKAWGNPAHKRAVTWPVTVRSAIKYA